MKHSGLSLRLRFAFAWPLLITIAVAAPLLWFVNARQEGNTAGFLALAVVVIGMVLMALGLSWWWLNQKLFRPLDKITRGAHRLAVGDLASRLMEPEVGELAPLTRGLNRIAIELEEQINLLASERERSKKIAESDLTKDQRMVQARRDLVANVSHELKTPLTAIRGYAETLEDGALDQPQVARRFTRSILKQCARLEALLGDLLTLSSMESRQQESVTEAVNLAQLGRRAVEMLAPRADKGQIELALRTPDALPTIDGKQDELERLLLNLIENAIKYNRPGGRVDMHLQAEGSDLVIEVRDTGIGIPEEALERIFERFYRVDKGRARDQGGTGLGLSIIKHVAKNHGGTVEVESRLGEGSIFRVRLPSSGGRASCQPPDVSSSSTRTVSA